jgi:hypothetical protein
MPEKKENAVEVYQDVQVMDSLKEPMALGEIFAKSGMFKDVKTAAQGCVKILAGKELGLSPIESLNSFYFVNDRLAMYANVMSSLIKRTQKYDYEVEKLDDLECIINFYKVIADKKELIGKSIFTIKDAAKAGLVNKDVWKNYARNMLFSRAMSNGVRWYCPQVVCGYITVEEAQDLNIEPAKTTVTIENGEVVKNG